LRVEALQRVDVKPLSAFVATSAKEARRRQGTPLRRFPIDPLFLHANLMGARKTGDRA
jgi:hypothetical protein